jgi:cobalt-zinc-cadmium resistance protein CzcA
LFSVYSIYNINFEVYPDISDIEVTVITEAKGLNAEEVEQLITNPLERYLNTIPNISSIRSNSTIGLSLIRIVFEEDTNFYIARQLVEEKLNKIILPKNIQARLGPITSSIGEIYRYVIEGPENLPLTKLKEIQDFKIIPKLLTAKGVVDVSTFGGLEKQFQVIINPIQLEKYNLSIESISKAIHSNNEDTSENYIKIGSNRLNIKTVGKIKKLEDIENIIVDNKHGVPLFIKDIAYVETSVYPPSGILGYIDKLRNREDDSGIEGIILMRKFENPSKTISKIKTKISELNQELSKEGIKIHTVYDRSHMNTYVLQNVLRSIFFSLLLLFFTLLIFFRSYTITFLCLGSLVFSTLFCFCILNLLDISMFLISLSTINQGLIVAISAILCDGFERQFNKEKWAKEHFLHVIIKNSEQLQKPILISISFLVFTLMPVFFLDRIEGKIIKPIALTQILMLLGCLLYCIFLVPFFISIINKKNYLKVENMFRNNLEEFYRILLNYSFYKKKQILLILISLSFLTIFIYNRLGSGFLTEVDEGNLWIRLNLPIGINMETSKNYSDIIRKEIANLDEVELVLTQVGRNNENTDYFGPNRIEILVEHKDYFSFSKNKKNKKHLIQQIKKILDSNFPGANYRITQPIIDSTMENSTGSSSDLAIFIKGYDLDKLRELAKNIVHEIKKIKGGVETGIEQEEKQTQIVIEIDRVGAARYGVNVEQINQIIKTAISGTEVSVVYEGEKKIDVILKLASENKTIPSSLSKLVIPNFQNQKIPLERVANIHLREAESNIFHDSTERALIIRTDIEDRPQEGFIRELNSKILEIQKKENFLSFHFGGEYENLKRGSSRLKIVILLTLVLVFIQLTLLFKGKFHRSFFILSNLPVPLMGGILFLYFRNISLNISVIVGMIFLISITVMANFLYLTHVLLYLDKKEFSFSEIINISVKNSSVFFLFIILSFIGLVPSLFGSGVTEPMSTIIIGGMVFSLFITLLTNPILFYHLEKFYRERLHYVR